MLRSRFITLGLLSVLLSVLATGVSPAADHRDAPALQNMGMTATPEIRALDLNDVYLFQAANPENTVMMMTVNPLLMPTESAFFSSTGTYEFKISNGLTAVTDPNPEITFSCKFTAPRAGRQEIRVTKITHGPGGKSELIARGQTGSNIAIRGGGLLRADVFDDPFFFDFLGFTGAGGRDFNDGLGTNPPSPQPDFFAGTNVSIIVLEVPSASLTAGGSNTITMWARTLNSLGVQIDRTALPVINPVLIRPNRFLTLRGRTFASPNTPQTTTPLKDRFNLTQAFEDVNMWRDEIRLNLIAFGNSNDDIPSSEGDHRVFKLDDILAVVNPDVLTFDVTNPKGFNMGPLNGRRLEDDVIDLELTVVIQFTVLTGDGVNANDKPFRNRFPYVAVRH